MKHLSPKRAHALLKITNVVLVFMLVASAALFVMKESTARAQLPPFGGLNLNTWFCSCSMNFRIVVGPPVGGIYMYQPGVTVLYPYFMVLRPGAWLLGLWGPPVACVEFVGKACAPTGAFPLMIIVGTSI